MLPEIFRAFLFEVDFMRFNTKKIALIGMFSAISVVLAFIGNLIPKVAGFLSYDPKDIAVVICGFILGPLSALAVSIISSLIEFFAFGTTGIIGAVMNILSTASFACIASLIYKKKRSYGFAILGLSIGVVVMTVIMVLWNYILTPLYMNVEREVVAGMLLSVFVPFNMGKGTLNALITIISYKPIVRALRRAHLVEERSVDNNKKKKN